MSVAVSLGTEITDGILATIPGRGVAVRDGNIYAAIIRMVEVGDDFELPLFIYKSEDNGESWVVLDSAEPDLAIDDTFGMCMDSNGHFHIIYKSANYDEQMQAVTSYNIIYWRYDGSWSTPTPILEDIVGFSQNMAIAIDKDDNLHVVVKAAIKENGIPHPQVAYISQDNGSWNSHETLPIDPHILFNGGIVPLVIDDDNIPHIYISAVSQGGLPYGIQDVTKVEGDWVSQVIISGEFALYPTGYHDAVTGDMYIAYLSTLDMETIDLKIKRQDSSTKLWGDSKTIMSLPVEEASLPCQLNVNSKGQVSMLAISTYDTAVLMILYPDSEEEYQSSIFFDGGVDVGSFQGLLPFSFLQGDWLSSYDGIGIIYSFSDPDDGMYYTYAYMMDLGEEEGPGESQDTPTVVKGTIPDAVTYMPKSLCERDGILYCAVTDTSSGSFPQGSIPGATIYSSENAGKTWSILVVGDFSDEPEFSSVGGAFPIALNVDGDGVFHLIFLAQHGNEFTPLYRSYDGGWSSIVPLAGENDPTGYDFPKYPFFLDVAIDDNGNFHLAWTTNIIEDMSSWGLFYRRQINGVWQATELVAEPESPFPVSIAVDEDNNPLIATVGLLIEGIYLYPLLLYAKDGTWSQETLAESVEVKDSCVVGYDKLTGDIYVCYTKRTLSGVINNLLAVTKCSGGTWSDEVIIAGDPEEDEYMVLYGIVIDPESMVNVLYASYPGFSEHHNYYAGGLKYVSCLEGSWQEPVEIFAPDGEEKLFNYFSACATPAPGGFCVVYTLLEPDAPDPSSFDCQVESYSLVSTDPPPLKIISIISNSSYPDKTISITDLKGNKFTEDCIVELHKEGHTPISATNIVVVSDTKITCDFDLTGAAIGSWDVVVEDTVSEETATLPRGFIVVSIPDKSGSGGFLPQIRAIGAGAMKNILTGEDITYIGGSTQVDPIMRYYDNHQRVDPNNPDLLGLRAAAATANLDAGLPAGAQNTSAEIDDTPGDHAATNGAIIVTSEDAQHGKHCFKLTVENNGDATFNTDITSVTDNAQCTTQAMFKAPEGKTVSISLIGDVSGATTATSTATGLWQFLPVTKTFSGDGSRIRSIKLASAEAGDELLVDCLQTTQGTTILPFTSAEATASYTTIPTPFEAGAPFTMLFYLVIAKDSSGANYRLIADARTADVNGFHVYIYGNSLHFHLASGANVTSKAFTWSPSLPAGGLVRAAFSLDENANMELAVNGLAVAAYGKSDKVRESSVPANMIIGKRYVGGPYALNGIILPIIYNYAANEEELKYLSTRGYEDLFPTLDSYMLYRGRKDYPLDAIKSGKLFR